MKNFFLIIKSHLKTPQYLFKNISWRINSSVSSKKLIFVLGTPRSGTTLLQKVLESHQSLFSIQSQTAIFSYQNFWCKNRIMFDLDKGIRDSLLTKSKDNVDFFENCVNYLEKDNSDKIFIEKTPQHISRLDFLLKHFPNAKFIHIVRNGRDCYCSATKHPFIPQSKSLKSFAKYYNKCLLQGIRNFNNPNVFTLHYEDLVNEPHKYVRNLMSFLKLTLEHAQIDASFRSKDKRAKLEQFKKLNEPINSTSVNRWKRELTERENLKFIKYAKFGLDYFNYTKK